MTENNFQTYSAAVSDRGLSEKRPQNEDSFLEMKNIGLFAVADGVGGAQAGDVASQMAMEILGEAFVNLQTGGDAEEMMKIAIERANSAIHQMSSDLPQLSTMATTIVALQLSGNIATIGHVGDSRLYRLDAKGSLHRETQDHSVVEEEVRAGRMTAAQAANHPSRNVISRALGAENTVEVDMKTIMFDSNTAFLLCSDGITRHINDFEIRELLLSNASPLDICQKMKEICYSRGAEDNLTAVIVKIIQTGAASETPNEASAAPVIDEEATVATARQAVSEPLPANVSDDYDEIPTRSLEMPVSMQTAPETEVIPPITETNYTTDDDEAYLMEEPVRETAPQIPSEPVEIPNTAAFAVSEPAAVVEQEPVRKEKDYTVYETEEKNDGGGFFGKLLSSLILLAVGAILGVGAYYVWLTMNAKPAEVPVLTPQSNNVSNSSDKKNRYNAEVNPASLIKQYETTMPKDASDFYNLGIANLKLKNYEEAKRQFIIARNNLKDVSDAETKAILETDIAQGLTIAQDKTAQLAFERESNILKSSEPANTANSNQ
jgi:protein phosphatase